MNKKGILLKNVLALVITAIGLGLIIIAGVKLYNLSKDQEFENAKKLLDSLIGKIENVKDGETGRPVIRGVEGWYLIGWSSNDNSRPDKCFFNSCICVCKKNRNIGRLDCQENGFCGKLNYNNVYFYNYLKDKGMDMIVNEINVIKELTNPIYKEQRLWAKEGVRHSLLEECATFSSGSSGLLSELLIYRKGRDINILRIDEFELEKFEAGCKK